MFRWLRLRDSLRRVLNDCDITLYQELPEQNSRIYPRSITMRHYTTISKVTSILSHLIGWNGRCVLLPIVEKKSPTMEWVAVASIFVLVGPVQEFKWVYLTSLHACLVVLFFIFIYLF